MITLRDLSIDDAQMIFIWRNTEEIIHLSTSRKKVTLDEHLQWIKESIDNSNRHLLIIEYQNIPVGQVRFDRTFKTLERATISMYLLPDYQNKNIGSMAIKQACTKIFNQWKDLNEIYAFVRDTNERSQKFFIKNNFYADDEYTITNHQTYQFSRTNQMNQINTDFYTQQVEKYGVDVKSLNWGSRESQELRFKILTEVGDLQNKSILDVGCGLGDLYIWLMSNNIDVKYTGIDITPMMIASAQRRFPTGNFQLIDILTATHTIPQFDYVVASGIFTYSTQDYFERLIKVMFSKADIALAFNSLSGRTANKEKDEFYADPPQTLALCETYTPNVKLRHDYHSGDFTIYMYK